ncbi:MAG: proline--tRNA ligase [Nitrospinae bacterium]|nr:proline--tRNA ligase [Nitrospinota bacterium]
MKYSQYFIPTIKDSPADAELTSHKLMVRAGMIRKLAAGIYNILPFGLKAIRKVENIVRDELNKAGAVEVFLPSIQPSSLWEETGRWLQYDLELLRVKDRHDREFCYGPTHEEVITDLVRNDIKSYKQLPVNLYQIQTKFRDEIRPRFGIMRAREFTMKDAYSFDATDAGANISFEKMVQAYDNIFQRCGLQFRGVDADSGAIGGDFSREYMVLAESGENEVAYCNSCDYAANVEKAKVLYKENIESTVPEEQLEEVHTPGYKSIEEVANFLKVTPADCVKCLIYETEEEMIALLIRGDRQVNEIKLKNFLGVETIALASDELIYKTLQLTTGYLGPVGMKISVYADNELQENRTFVTGANKDEFHLKNVDLSRDAQIKGYGDFRNIEANDPCPSCGKHGINFCRGIEVGHVFKLGTKYSEKMNATFLDQNGKSQHFIMGCYGIGIGRTVAAAIEQNNDDKGIIWPKEIAPFHVHLVSLFNKDSDLMEASEKLYNELIEAGVEVLWDDRNESVGKKFKDADLLGLPLQIVFGKPFQEEKQVEITERKTLTKEKFPLNKAVEIITKKLS